MRKVFLLSLARTASGDFGGSPKGLEPLKTACKKKRAILDQGERRCGAGLRAGCGADAAALLER